jgi:hypothetical protein
MQIGGDVRGPPVYGETLSDASLNCHRRPGAPGWLIRSGWLPFLHAKGRTPIIWCGLRPGKLVISAQEGAAGFVGRT